MFGGLEDDEEDDVVDAGRWLTFGAPMGSGRVASASMGFVIDSVAIEMVRIVVDDVHAELGQFGRWWKGAKLAFGLTCTFDIWCIPGRPIVFTNGFFGAPLHTATASSIIRPPITALEGAMM